MIWGVGLVVGLTALSLSLSGAATVQAVGLDSWNDGPEKKSIVAFVKAATQQGGPGFISPADRIAVFDNDGTLWAEQPFYLQLAFAVDRVKAMAPEHPEWKTEEPFAALLKGDVKGALAGGEKAILEIVMASHAGMTTDEFSKVVEEWVASARHPKLDRPYTELVYKPKLDFLDDKAGKPVAINKFIGRRPVIAFGNSDGDQQMLQWTAAGDGPRLMGLVHHTDAKREWAYDRESHIGKLDKALDEANKQGWTVVDMMSDWSVVFE